MTSRSRLVTFEEWNAALRSPVLPSHPIASPTSDAIVVTRYFLSPIQTPAAPELPEDDWVEDNWVLEPAREIFLPRPQPIRLEPVTRDDTRQITRQWNKPSRVENFLMRCDKNQTLSTLVFVVLLLLWLI